jgi:hypothetical protein
MATTGDPGGAFRKALQASTETARALEQTTKMIEEARANSAAVLRAVKAYRGFTDTVLAMRSAGEMSRAAVQHYMSGRTVLNVDKMVVFGEALAMPPKLFLGSAEDALRWVLDNSPNPDPPPTRSLPSTKWYSRHVGTAA